MRILFLISVFILSFVLTILFASSGLFTLKDEADGYPDTKTWIKGRNGEKIPITSGKGVSNNKQSLNAHPNENLFYKATDQGFGFSQLINNDRASLLNVRWYSTDGERAGQWQHAWPYDKPLPALRIDPISGDLIVVDLSNQVFLINETGDLVKNFPLTDSLYENSENNAYIDFNQGLLAAGITEVIPVKGSQPDFRTTIVVLTLNGDVIWHRLFPDWRIRALNSSADGRLIAASFYKKEEGLESYSFRSLVFGADGKEIDSRPVRFRQALFDEKNNRVFLMDKNSGYLIDLKTNKRMATIESGVPERLFLSAVFMPPSQYLAIQEGKASRQSLEKRPGWIYSQISIRSVDRSGNQGIPWSVEGIEVIKPTLTYDESSQDLFLGYRNGWKIYHLTIEN